MQMVGIRGQFVQDHLYAADGTITAGGTPQLVLPRAKARSYFLFQNNSANTMYLEFGGARATATVAGGVVTGFTVTNGGFGYVKVPSITCFGGGPVDGNADANCGATLPDWPSPGRAAKGLATVAAGIVTAIAVSDPGAGYLRAPYVLLENHSADSIGVADPFFSSVTRGFQILAAGVMEFAQQCSTDAVAVYGTTTGDKFTCRWMY